MTDSRHSAQHKKISAVPAGGVDGVVNSVKTVPALNRKRIILISAISILLILLLAMVASKKASGVPHNNITLSNAAKSKTPPISGQTTISVQSSRSSNTGSSTGNLASGSNSNNDSTNTSAAQNNSVSNTSVNVDGQNVPVPNNSSVSQTIDNGNSHTTVNIYSQSSGTTSTGSSSNSSNNSTQVQVNSSSDSTTSSGST